MSSRKHYLELTLESTLDSRKPFFFNSQISVQTHKNLRNIRQASGKGFWFSSSDTTDLIRVSAMVLWEITLATAYCLGLRKTYRLALRLQRRVVPRRFPKVRDFFHRRTRDIFDVVLAVHQRIQQKDISQKKSFGNYVLRVLDRARPSANISGKSDLKHLPTKISNPVSPSDLAPHNRFMLSHPEKFRSQIGQAIKNRFSNRFSVGTGRVCPGGQNSKPESEMRPYSNLAICSESRSPFVHNRGVFREDIAKWMVRRR